MIVYRTILGLQQCFPLYIPAVKRFGVNTAFFLSFMIWRQKDPEAWVEISRDEIEEETTLTRRHQEEARKVLGALGIIQERENRPRNLKYYRIDVVALDAAFESTVPTGEFVPSEPKCTVPTGEFVQSIKGVKKEEKEEASAPQIAEPSPSKKPSDPAAVPNPEHYKFIKLYCDAWKERNGSVYVFQRGIDNGQLKLLLKATGATAEELMAVVHKAWEKSSTDRKNYWSCATQTGTIAGFCAAYNKIKVELRNGKEYRGYVSPARRGQNI